MSVNYWLFNSFKKSNKKRNKKKTQETIRKGKKGKVKKKYLLFLHSFR